MYFPTGNLEGKERDFEIMNDHNLNATLVKEPELGSGKLK